MAKQQASDVVIVGGGMVGLSLALLLAARLPETKIILVEAFAAVKDSASSPQFRPSFDARSTALSESSRAFFTCLDLWSQLSEHLTDIETIHVSDRGHIGSTRLSASEEKLPALGYVIENQWLGQVLMAAVGNNSQIETIAPAKPVAIRPQADGVSISLSSGEKINAALLVVADGANSETRNLLGINHQSKNYGQMAIVANVSFTNSHNNQAFERFTSSGPVALLPLQPFEGLARSALIWTLPPEQCETLMAADEDNFLQALQQHFGNRLGQFQQVGQRSCYPIKLVTSDELCRRNIAVVGNAASALHPVAGQGFNLALRGVIELTDQLEQAKTAGKALGDLAVLQVYAQQHQADRGRTILLSDLLPKVFGNQSAPIALGRNASLLAMDALPIARKLFSRLGTGIQLDKGLM